MNTLYVSSEAHPFSKVGGLSDVAGSLPIWLNKTGIKSNLVIPYCREVEMSHIKMTPLLSNIPITFNGQTLFYNVLQSFFPRTTVPVYLIDNQEFFRGVTVYTGDSANDAVRYVFLSKVVVDLSSRIGVRIDIIHYNDFFGGFVPYYLGDNSQIKTFLTIHNIGSQGIFPRALLKNELDTKKLVASEEGIVNIIRESIVKSGKINTVSRTYRNELFTPEYAFGTDELLLSREKDFIGILNGVNYEEFDPAKDSFLYNKYNVKSLALKAKNKKSLQKELGLREVNVPIISMVTRLVNQKGLDLLLEVFDDLMLRKVQFVLLGRGEGKYENFFKAVEQKYRGRVSSTIDFNEVLEHKIYAGSDLYLMPSRFEPGGLSDLIALKYGTVPIVRSTGGLADAIIDIEQNHQLGNGFSFVNYNSQEMLNRIDTALAYYKNKDVWRKLTVKDMDCDFSWSKSAMEYKEAYESLFSKSPHQQKVSSSTHEKEGYK